MSSMYRAQPSHTDIKESLVYVVSVDEAIFIDLPLMHRVPSIAQCQDTTLFVWY